MTWTLKQITQEKTNDWLMMMLMHKGWNIYSEYFYGESFPKVGKFIFIRWNLIPYFLPQSIKIQKNFSHVNI